MPRKPLPIGEWGLIRTYKADTKTMTRYRAVANFRDFDGRTRRFEAWGKSATQARQNLVAKMQSHVRAGRGDDLNAMTTFTDAAAVWLDRLHDQVKDGTRSPTTYENYARQLRIHVLPAMGAVRLGEATTPLVDRVIRTIKLTISPATAKTCKSVISGVMGLAVRQGAILSNPVREIERIEATPKRPPRGLSDVERVLFIAQLLNDRDARRKDLPDLVFFMLATGIRIGEALAIVWSEVDLDQGTVTITSTLIRVRGEGLLRKSTKSKAGVRTLPLPLSAVATLRARFQKGAKLHQPVFPGRHRRLS